MLQVLVTTGGGDRMVFEFPPTRRELARTLTAHLGDGTVAEAAGGEPRPEDRAGAVRGDDNRFWGPSTQPS